MLHPSTKRLIDKLSEMTRKQRVSWTEGENGTLVHDTEGYRVVLTPEPHAVLLTDTLGREIETCRPEEFSDELDSQGQPYARFISELYREASRHARGTERAIRTLLAELDAAEELPATVPEVAVTPSIGAPDATTDETAPLESETEITAAVATLADQINAAQPADPAPVSEAAPPPEPAPGPAPQILAAPQPEPDQACAPDAVLTAPETGPVMPEAANTGEPVLDLPVRAPEPPPAGEEPGSFGTFAAFEPEEPAPPASPEIFASAPEPHPESLIAPDPEPVAETATPATEAPEPAPEPAPAPQMAPPTLAGPISLSSIPFGFGLGAAQREGTPVHPSSSAPAAPDPGPAPATEPPKRILIDGTLDLPDFTPDRLEADVHDAYPPPAPASGPLDIPAEPAPPGPEPGQPRRFNPWN